MSYSNLQCPFCSERPAGWHAQHLDGKRMYACPKCGHRMLFSTWVAYELQPLPRRKYEPLTTLDVGKPVAVKEVRQEGGYWEWPRDLAGVVTAVDSRHVHVRVRHPEEGERHAVFSRKTGVETTFYQRKREGKENWLEIDGGVDEAALADVRSWPEGT